MDRPLTLDDVIGLRRPPAQAPPAPSAEYEVVLPPDSDQHVLTTATGPVATRVKTVPGAVWDAQGRAWRVPVHRRSARSLRDVLASTPGVVSPRARDLLSAAADDPSPPPDVTMHPDGASVIVATPMTPGLLSDLKRHHATARDGQWILTADQVPALAKLAAKHDLIIDPAAFTVSDPVFDYDHTINGLRRVPITVLRTVRARADKADKFTAAGITTVWDLLHTIPRRYLDRSTATPIRDLTVGETVGFVGQVASTTGWDRTRRLVRYTISDGTGEVSVTFFQSPWQAHRFRVGDTVVVYGKLDQWQPGRTSSSGSGRGGRRYLQMSNPVMDVLHDDTALIVPVYPQSGKHDVSTWDLNTALTEALTRLGDIHDPLPDALRHDHDLMGRGDAYRAVHRPASLAQAQAARDRVAFDELFMLQAGLLLSKQHAATDHGITHNPDGPLTNAFHDGLPFPLTNAQTTAITDIDTALASPSPMHRLLQGDVGAGKTLVAVHTLLAAVQSGHQAALMAPTEILATQLHAEVTRRTTGLTLEGVPLRVELFTNKARGKHRQQLLTDLADGSIHIAVGTHALISDDVAFASLGAAVIDEQHRFGVTQRADLRSKGPRTATGEPLVPDVLVMTATPIPRTAALCLFGDLDVTTLDELPPGRTPVATEWIDTEPDLDDATLTGGPWALIREQVAAGHQAYVVCPLVEDSEKLQAANATDTHDRLAAGALAGLHLGLVHGQQKPDDRASTMAAFRDGHLDVLVATTVIEVGVDVPNATVIVILDPARFGIAQLHQLRGRVGRAQHESTCILYGPGRTPDSRERLTALTTLTDGFALAEIDLRLRKAGSLFGDRQSGLSDLRVADPVDDAEILTTARVAAAGLLTADPDLTGHPRLAVEIRDYAHRHDLTQLRRS